MKVSIEHRDKASGLIFKTHQIEVTVAVIFSEEELAIIKARKLKDYVILKREPDRRTIERLGADYVTTLDFSLRIKDLMSSRLESFVCDTPVDAKLYEQNLTAALKTLKDFITGNAETGTSTTFEL